MVKYDGALPILLRASDLCKNIYGEDHLTTAKVYYILAELYWNQCILIFFSFSNIFF
jgi:hypothetical protein